MLITVRSDEVPRLTLVRTLPREAQLQAAALIFDTLPEFYQIITQYREHAMKIIHKEFSLDASEIGSAVCACENTQVTGVYAGLLASQVVRARTLLLARIYRSTPPGVREALKVRIKDYSAQFPRVPDDSYYLARLAVTTDRFGTGLGKALLNSFFRDGSVIGSYSLHVRADNRRAIHFYERHGFSVIRVQRTRFTVMLATRSRATNCRPHDPATAALFDHLIGRPGPGAIQHQP